MILQGFGPSRLPNILCMSAMASAATVSPVFACTRVVWSTAEQGVYVGRTQDWTERVNTKFRKFPRGEQRTGAVDGNQLTWTSKYGSLTLTGYDVGTHEGVNEAGLSAHLLYLAEGTNFGERDMSRPGISIVQWAQYYLDNFATVDEAVADIERDGFQVVPITFPNGKESLLHLSIEDQTGDSAVVEWIDGAPKVYHDRKFTVMTNEPTFDRQIENLRQYRTFGGDAPLPGERTPTDRFVRAMYYEKALPEPKNSDVGAAYILSVMRNVSVPFGAADLDKPNVSNTIFRSIIDFDRELYYFESTFAPNVVWIDYSEMDFEPESGETVLPVEENIFSLSGDVTDRLTAGDDFNWGG